MNRICFASAALALLAWPASGSAAPGLGLTKQQWHEDLAFLAQRLPQRHANAFHSVSRASFAAAVAELDRKLDQLNSDEIYVGMDHIAILIGDAHTYIRAPADPADFPIELRRFGDEYRVAAIAAGNETALGARVIKIQDTPIARAQEILSSLTPADETEVLRDLRVTAFLTAGVFLHGTGIIPDRAKARYTLADDSGKEFAVDLQAVAPAESSKLNWIYAFKERPLFRQRPGESFWYTYLPDSRTVYCSFRGYEDLRQHAPGLLHLVDQRHPEKLVIDLRLNGGGDYEKGLKYLVHPIRALSAINRKGHLFVLIGPGTFSAAMSNAAHFRYQTNAILVGQQIGEKPNSYQEAREIQLPNSHWTVRYSVRFYKFVESGENLIRPDQEILPSWDDYRSGRDPVLEWVLDYGARNSTSKPWRDVSRGQTGLHGGLGARRQLFRGHGGQRFDDGDGGQQLRRQVVPLLQICGAVVGDPDLSRRIFPDQDLQRQIDGAAGRRQHQRRARLGVAEDQ